MLYIANIDTCIVACIVVHRSMYVGIHMIKRPPWGLGRSFEKGVSCWGPPDFMKRSYCGVNNCSTSCLEKFNVRNNFNPPPIVFDRMHAWIEINSLCMSLNRQIEP